MVIIEDDRYHIQWDAKETSGLQNNLYLGEVVNITDGGSLLLFNGILSSRL
jgi:hypothetical protein